MIEQRIIKPQRQPGYSSKVVGVPAFCRLFGLGTLQQINEYALPCTFNSIRGHHAYSNTARWVVMGDSQVCILPLDLKEMRYIDTKRVLLDIIEEPGQDLLRYVAFYKLAPTSDGIDLLSEEFSFSFGGIADVIPAGGFICESNECTYESESGLFSSVVITDLGGRFKIILTTNPMATGTIAQPVPMILQIGDDLGSTEVRIHGLLEQIGWGT